MSKYYNGRKTRNLFDPQSKSPFRLSRSKFELFISCPRCFYLDRRLGLGQPPGYPFSLNSAVDKLLKKEFDLYRSRGIAHPIMELSGIKAIPFKHEKLDYWRDALRGGIEYLHKSTNLLISGGIDDLWIGPEGELFIVDYKSTSKEGEVTIDADWQLSYKRQMEIYQWLFRKNSFRVSPIGYFVYCNADARRETFDGKLEFDIKIIPYEGSDNWIEGKIVEMYQCLISQVAPRYGEDCDFCKYQKSLKELKMEGLDENR
ncbi:MAG: PD-(D/E)XK nuclease superfamily protein [Candidatus Omnitrophica bacterium ADurb.Bin205]|nr:MAG: PD-(D/E)XK nuclease superfamily protein [Candidatus Omnitrophica bacterium ADurb.Bin205]